MKLKYWDLTLHKSLNANLKVMLHGAIRKNDFQRNTALQRWNNVATVRNNVATMMQAVLRKKSSLRIVSCDITLMKNDFLIKEINAKETATFKNEEN